MLKLGLDVPKAAQVGLQDPKLLAWLHKPQLVQRDGKEIEGYTLQVNCCKQASNLQA